MLPLLLRKTPSAVHIALPHRIGGAVPGNRIRDKLRGHSVVFQDVIELVGLHHGHAVIAGIVCSGDI
jgi:hypothetical protein